MNLSPILYAEDEPDDIYFLQRAFKESGITNPLLVVGDGKRAIDYLDGAGEYANRAEHPLPCLTILDLNLPEKTGIEVLKWIRAQPHVCVLPVIMLTSSSQEEDMHRAYIQGANGFLIKPGRPDDLLAMARAIRDFWLVQNRTVPESFKSNSDAQTPSQAG